MSKPNVIIITQGVSRIVKPILENSNVVGVIQTERKTNKPKSQIFRKVVKEWIDLFRKNKKTLKIFSKSNNIPYYFMNNGNDIRLEKWIRDKKPDLIIVYMMSELLKENIFNIPKYGTINLHPSKLPDYRGPNPWFWNYYDMNKKGGITLHYIDKGEDTGDLIYQKIFDIPLGIRSTELFDLAIGKIGVKLILKCIKNYKNLPRTKQTKETTTVRARNIKQNEHTNLIDWVNWDVERVWHLLRGTELWLNAIDLPYKMFNGQRWVIEEYIKCNTEGYMLGKAIRENGKYFIACRNGIIYIKINFNIKQTILNVIK